MNSFVVFAFQINNVCVGYDVATLSENLDWIAVMTYDYHGQWDKITGHVAPMYPHPDDVDVTFNAVSYRVLYSDVVSSSGRCRMWKVIVNYFNRNTQTANSRLSSVFGVGWTDSFTLFCLSLHFISPHPCAQNTQPSHTLQEETSGRK